MRGVTWKDTPHRELFPPFETVYPLQGTTCAPLDPCCDNCSMPVPRHVFVSRHSKWNTPCHSTSATSNEKAPSSDGAFSQSQFLLETRTVY